MSAGQRRPDPEERPGAEGAAARMRSPARPRSGVPTSLDLGGCVGLGGAPECHPARPSRGKGQERHRLASLPDVETLSLRFWRAAGVGGRPGTCGALGSGPSGGRKGTSATSRQGARAAAGGCAPKLQRRPSPNGRAPRARQEPQSPGPAQGAAAGPSQPDPGPGPAGAGSSASRPSRSVMAKPRGREPVGGPPGTSALLLARPSESASRPVMASQAAKLDPLSVTFAEGAQL